MPSHKIESEMADMHVSLARWPQRNAMEGCLYKGSYHAEGQLPQCSFVWRGLQLLEKSE